MNKEELSQLIKKEGDIHEFDHNGLKCVVKRNQLLVWTGYVGVSPAHALYGYDHSDIIPVTDKLLNRGVDPKKISLVSFMMFCATKLKDDKLNKNDIPLNAVIRAYRGINYSESELYHLDNKLYSNEDNLWWFGFDCGHQGDLIPVWLEEDKIQAQGNSIYRNKEFVIKETKLLAEELIDFKFGKDEQTREKTKG